MQHLRVRKDIAHGVDRSSRYATALQLLQHIRARDIQECSTQLREQHVAVGDAASVFDEPRIGCQRRLADYLADLAELRVIAAGKHDVAVANREDLIRNDVWMRRAKTAR